MRIAIRYSAFTALAVLTLASAFLAGCPAKNNPNNPAPQPTSTSTTTATPNPNGPLLVGFYLWTDQMGVTAIQASLLMIDHLGNEITNASATLTTPNGSIPVTYLGEETINFPAGTGVTNFMGASYYGAATTYIAGQNCAFSVVDAGITYTADFTPINPAASGVTGTSGVTFNWANGGNENFIQVKGNDTLLFGPPLASPYSISAADFTGDPAGSGHDTVSLDLLQVVSSAFSGAQSSSVVITGSSLALHY